MLFQNKFSGLIKTINALRQFAYVGIYYKLKYIHSTIEKFTSNLLSKLLYMFSYFKNYPFLLQ